MKIYKFCTDIECKKTIFITKKQLYNYFAYFTWITQESQ